MIFWLKARGMLLYHDIFEYKKNAMHDFFQVDRIASWHENKSK